MLYTCTSLRKQTTFCDGTTGFLQNDVWKTSAEIPYWCCVTTQIWVVLLIGRVAWEICFNQSEALLGSLWWCIISMKFLCLFLRCHFTGKPVVVLRKVRCFPRLAIYKLQLILCLAGSGVVTRRPLILQLVHTPPKATTNSKRSSKGIKPKSVEDEDGDSCEKWVLHLLLIMTLQNFGCTIIVTNPNKTLLHHSASAPPQLVAC